MPNLRLPLMLIFLLAMVAVMLLSPHAAIFIKGLALILLMMFALWLLSLAIRDSSIVDIFWGLGFVIVSWSYWFNHGSGLRAVLFCVLVTIWGLRLALHIGIRNWGKGEDYRYQTFREQAGAHYWWISLFQVFFLQGLLLWGISSVFLPALANNSPFPGWTDILGLVCWLTGFFFEAVGDWQLVRFKKNPANKGKVLETGLWRYTRHPNYFGDALLWWGYFFFALSGDQGWLFIPAPFLMTYLLVNVSGVALLERGLKERRPEYEAYRKRTSAFIPWPPRKG